MRVKRSELIGGMSGSVNRTTYVRAIPGNTEWFTVCKKPHYSKKALSEMAQRPAVLKFNAVTQQASAILKNEEQKTEWQRRHLAAKREASRHQKKANAKGKNAVPERLYDFIRWELNKE